MAEQESLQKDLAIVRQAVSFCRALARLDEVLSSVLKAEQMVIEGQSRKDALDKDIAVMEASFIEKQDKLASDLVAFRMERKVEIETEAAKYTRDLLAAGDSYKEELVALAAQKIKCEQQLKDTEAQAAARRAELEGELGNLEVGCRIKRDEFEALSSESDTAIASKQEVLEALEKQHTEALSTYQKEEAQLEQAISTLRKKLGRIRESIPNVA